MSEDRLFDFAASVSTRHDFVMFVGRLKAEHHQYPDKWANNDLNSYLDGLEGFAHDMENGGASNSDGLTWRVAAQMLLAATVYE